MFAIFYIDIAITTKYLIIASSKFPKFKYWKFVLEENSGVNSIWLALFKNHANAWNIKLKGNFHSCHISLGVLYLA